jgi:subtilisin family serine protease
MSPYHLRRPTNLLSAAAVIILAGGLTAGLAANAAGAATEGRIRVPAGAEAVPGSYIVVLNSSATARSAAGVADTARTLATRHGGTVSRTYASAVRGFALRASHAQAEALAADPAVAYVEQDTVVKALDTQNNATWGLDRVDQRARPLSGTYTYNTTAANVNAYIIDTGVDSDHPDLEARVSLGTDTVGDGRNGEDCNGHGTHVAGTVGGETYGLAKEVTLYAVRVLNCSGRGSNSGVIGGVDWVTRNASKPAVANMSLGGSASSALDTAVRNSINSGVTYALAAGNENQSACNVSPARTAEAITVGATTNADARSSFSNHGTCVDIFAPGSGITSAWAGGGTNTISGTSMASPHAAGAAALYLAVNPSATPQQVRDGLVNAATPNVVTNPGTGSPNRLLYTLFDGTPPPPPPPPGELFENTARVDIPDAGAAVESPISVTGVTGNAPTGLQVGVDIRHTYRGDLVVSLVAPDGSSYPLSNRSGGSADNVVETFTVNASAEAANGTWRLRVQDVARSDTGYIAKFSLQF